jgi:hypothetical protein
LASNTKLSVLYYFLIFITGGLFYAFSRFKPLITAKVKHTETPLEIADYVLIRVNRDDFYKFIAKYVERNVADGIPILISTNPAS